MNYPYSGGYTSDYTVSASAVGSRLLSLGQSVMQGAVHPSQVVSELKSAISSIRHSHPNAAGLMQMISDHITQGGSTSAANVSGINWGAVGTGLLLGAAILLA